MAGESSVLAEVIVKLISNILEHVLGPRSNIVYFSTDSAFAVLGNQQVNTHQIGIQNLGRQVERVQVIHNWPPGSFYHVVSPLRPCHDLVMQGRVAFEIDYIRPGETILITYIHGTPPPQPLLNSISTTHSEAKKVDFPLTSRRYSRWVIISVAVSAILGLVVEANYVIQGIKMLLHALSHLSVG